MNERFDPAAARGASAAILLAVALAGCSDGGDEDAGGGVPIADAAAGADAAADDDPVGGNPFEVDGGGTREPADADADDAEAPDAPDATQGGAPDADADADVAASTIPFGAGADIDAEVEDPSAEPVDGEVLPRLENAVVDDSLADAWICPTDAIDGYDAVGYAFLGGAGALFLFDADGEFVSATFTSDESVPGTVVNAYEDIDVVESIADFRFVDADRFTASSDATGELDCERFFLGADEDDAGDDAEAVDGELGARIDNGTAADGGLESAWVCVGPQLQTDVSLYVFRDGRGVFFAANRGDEDLEPVFFTYAERGADALELTYENGAVETLDGVVFVADGRFDAVSSVDGPLTCSLES